MSPTKRSYRKGSLGSNSEKILDRDLTESEGIDLRQAERNTLFTLTLLFVRWRLPDNKSFRR